MPSCPPGQQSANADDSRTDGAKDTHDGYTTRPAARAAPTRPRRRPPSWAIARSTWSNPGWPFRSRGRGSIVRSRDPGTSPRERLWALGWAGYREQGRDANAPRRCCEHASSIALPQATRHTKPCLHAAMPSCHQCSAAAVQSSVSRHVGGHAAGAPPPPPSPYGRQYGLSTGQRKLGSAILPRISLSLSLSLPPSPALWSVP